MNRRQRREQARTTAKASPPREPLPPAIATLSADARRQYERLVAGEIDEAALADLTSDERQVISATLQTAHARDLARLDAQIAAGAGTLSGMPATERRAVLETKLAELRAARERLVASSERTRQVLAAPEGQE
jgi:hypothetical protein